jgi:hypothetical protein
MANWQHRLELRDLWEKYRKGQITPIDEGKEVAKRLRNLIPKLPTQFQDGAEEIAIRFDGDIENIEDFDNVLSDLYDLADTALPTPSGEYMPRKLMWVATF